jgi:hypothetical protein
MKQKSEMNKECSMRRWPLVFLLLVTALSALAQSGAASPAGSINPADIVGTWELNLHNSSLGNLPPPKSATINVLRYDENGMQWTAQETDENGNTIKEAWQGALDGLPAPATRTDEAVHYAFQQTGEGVNYAFQQTDEGILEVTTFPDGTRITSLGTVSSDGRTLTLKRRMTSPTRGLAAWTEIYDKVAGR